MNRRSFLSSITKALLGAAIAANLELGSLVRVPEISHEAIVQPLYDIYSVMADTQSKPLSLFEVPC